MEEMSPEEAVNGTAESCNIIFHNNLCRANAAEPATCCGRLVICVTCERTLAFA